MSLLSSSTVDGCSLLYVRLAVLILCSSHLLCVEAIYCGKRNCYDVLQVSREDDRTSIRRAYHKLARVHHPDRQKTAKAKAEAEETIRIINAAYEVLSDPEQREEYDYMLDHPDEMYYNYYQYYRRRYAPKVDVRLVILAIVLICSVFQYVGQWTSYNQAISYLVRDPKHRARAKEIANSEGLLAARKREDGRRYTREEMKDKEEELLRSIISRTVELKGDCSKPSLRRVLLIQIFCLPYTLFQLMHWAFSWIWNYYILRREYDEVAQVFITRRRLGLSAAQWDGLDEEKRQSYLQKKLWIRENYKAYLQAQAEEMRLQAAESSQHKRYRRYVKRAGGPPQLGMEDMDL